MSEKDRETKRLPEKTDGGQIFPKPAKHKKKNVEKQKKKKKDDDN